MFDFGWIELMVIGLVVVLVLGPNELPHAMRSLAKFMRKARRLAAEFQGHFDDMLRETELDEVKKQVDQLRRTNISSEIEKTIDPDGKLKRDYSEAVATLDAPPASKAEPKKRDSDADSKPAKEAKAVAPPPPVKDQDAPHQTEAPTAKTGS